MKSVVRIVVMIAGMLLASLGVWAQAKLDEERMQRDLEVAENILSTLLKQQFDKRSFFPMEVRGSYRQGYGVTFQIPSDNGFFFLTDGPGNFAQTIGSGGSWSGTVDVFSEEDAPVIINPNQTVSASQMKRDQERKATSRVGAQARAYGSKTRTQNLDSLRDQSSGKMIEAAKQFMADYGDLITQLAPSERIIITNRGEEGQYQFWLNGVNMQTRKNPYVTVEGLKSDIAQLRQGKITRDQFLKKLKVVNTESDIELHPDLELLSSIFNRLYRSDLSKTYFAQENTYYERLKDYGVIYYMEVYSTNTGNYGDDYIMPTLGLSGIDMETRNKKVKELYPIFAKNIKEDILEYGKTLKSLKDDENLIFNIKLTRCKGCDIPAWIEYSVKYGTLKDYSNGKISKESALEKFTEKKGEIQ